MWSAISAFLVALLKAVFSLGAKPAGAREAEDAPNQKEINDEIDNLPPNPYH